MTPLTTQTSEEKLLQGPQDFLLSGLRPALPAQALTRFLDRQLGERYGSMPKAPHGCYSTFQFLSTPQKYPLIPQSLSPVISTLVFLYSRGHLLVSRSLTLLPLALRSHSFLGISPEPLVLTHRKPFKRQYPTRHGSTCR